MSEKPVSQRTMTYFLAGKDLSIRKFKYMLTAFSMIKELRELEDLIFRVRTKLKHDKPYKQFKKINDRET